MHMISHFDPSCAQDAIDAGNIGARLTDSVRHIGGVWKPRVVCWVI